MDDERLSRLAAARYTSQSREVRRARRGLLAGISVTDYPRGAGAGPGRPLAAKPLETRLTGGHPGSSIRDQIRREPDQLRHGQADHGEEVALHLRHERRSSPLDRVATGTLAPLPAREVVVDVALL
jgi:hypothetical protein